MRARRGFTLVELLVVIAIIALLISILLPTLNKAKAAAGRAACLSNQRQLMQAIYLYSVQYKGGLPQPVRGGQASISHWVFYPFLINDTRGGIEGWFNLGYLFITRIMKDNRAFYCPDQKMDAITYQGPWKIEDPGPNVLMIGYSYRIFNQPYGTYPITHEAQKELLEMKFGSKMKGIKALTCDVLGPRSIISHWSHVRPFGLCVGYSDGHGEFVETTEEIYRILGQLTGGSPRQADEFHYLMFRAFDTRDFSAVNAHFGID